MNRLLDFARGNTDTPTMKIWILEDGTPTIFKEELSDQNLSICVCDTPEDKKRFPNDGITIFVSELSDAKALYEI